MSLCRSAVQTPDLWPAALHALASAIATAETDRESGHLDGEARRSSDSYRDLLAGSFAEGWDAAGPLAQTQLPFDGTGHRSAVPGWLKASAAPAPGRDDAWRSGAETDPDPDCSIRGGKVMQANPEAAGPIDARFGVGRDHATSMEGVLGALAALDHLHVPAVALDERGWVRKTNAQVDVSPGSGLRINRHVLIAEDAASQLDLQRLIHDVVNGGDALARPALRPAVIRRSMRRPLVVDVAHVGSGLADLLDGGAFLLISDLERSALPVEAHVRRAFELTRSELRLVMRIAEGEDLAACGESLGWSRETTRTVLKTVFSKTETHRQAELVALLARLRY